MRNGQRNAVAPRRQALSHSFVIRAATSFGWNPIDDLIRVGDVTGFAVDAVRRVDFELRGAFFGNDLIDGGGTEILAGVSVLPNTAIAANVGVEDMEVAGLILFVSRARMIDIGETVE